MEDSLASAPLVLYPEEMSARTMQKLPFTQPPKALQEALTHQYPKSISAQ